MVPLPTVWKNRLKTRSVCIKIGVLEQLYMCMESNEVILHLLVQVDLAHRLAVTIIRRFFVDILISEQTSLMFLLKENYRVCCSFFIDKGTCLEIFSPVTVLLFSNEITHQEKSTKLATAPFNLQAPRFLYIGQAFRYSPENAFYTFNQQTYFII